MNLDDWLKQECVSCKHTLGYHLPMLPSNVSLEWAQRVPARECGRYGCKCTQFTV